MDQSRVAGLVVTCGDNRLHGEVRKYMHSTARVQEEKYLLHALAGSFIWVAPSVALRMPAHYHVFRHQIEVYLSVAAAGHPASEPIPVWGFYHTDGSDECHDCAGWRAMNRLVQLEPWAEVIAAMENVVSEEAAKIGRSAIFQPVQARISAGLVHFPETRLATVTV